jgi:hypothetical protein
METDPPLLLTWENITICPITHYNLEMAQVVRQAFDLIKPDTIAVEFPEPHGHLFLRAASRLPDISLIKLSVDKLENPSSDSDEPMEEKPLYFMCEPCDPLFEAIRLAVDHSLAYHCIDLDLAHYPLVYDPLPDPYAITRIGHRAYMQAYFDLAKHIEVEEDQKRELHMARRLKELSFRHERILFVCGAAHAKRIVKYMELDKFPEQEHNERTTAQLITLTEDANREVMAECGYFTLQYEKSRESGIEVDRQKSLYGLFREAGEQYQLTTGNDFPGYHMRNLMKYARNYALLTGRLIPDMYQILAIAKGCVDHNYAYAVWELATQYPYRKNIDGLPEFSLRPEEVWGREKKILFHLKHRSKKSTFLQRRKNDKQQHSFRPTGTFSICSHQPEDIVIERFGEFLQKKGKQILQNESSRTIEFSGSLEDGIDLRETIRHWHEGKLFVKVGSKPKGEVGSVVVIFDPDSPEEAKLKEKRGGQQPEFQEKYPWKTTWLGEHEQESDMSFYATRLGENVVGPGISRCEYGGFMMSYPPRRMFDIWSDPDYSECRTKHETLLIAAIDYAVEPLVVYVAPSPPRSFVKSYARRFNKKVIYVPIGQISPIMINRIRAFHVLDGHNKREIAGDYIF